MDTVEANLALGFDDDERILHRRTDLTGFRSEILKTVNQQSVKNRRTEDFGLEIEENGCRFRLH